MTPKQNKFYQLAKDSFPVISIMGDEDKGEMRNYGIRFSWQKSSKKNITVGGYEPSGDGKDITELRLSSTLKPSTEQVCSELRKLLAKLRPAKKPKAPQAKPKASAAKAPKPMEAIPEVPDAKPAAKAKNRLTSGVRFLGYVWGCTCWLCC